MCLCFSLGFCLGFLLIFGVVWVCQIVGERCGRAHTCVRAAIAHTEQQKKGFFWTQTNGSFAAGRRTATERGPRPRWKYDAVSVAVAICHDSNGQGRKSVSHCRQQDSDGKRGIRMLPLSVVDQMRCDFLLACRRPTRRFASRHSREKRSATRLLSGMTAL